MNDDKGFKSKIRGHSLQWKEKVDIIFDLVTMMAEDKHKAKYDKIKEDYNKDE